MRALDELWEQWATVAIVRGLAEHLGPPTGETLLDAGWFATLRRGPIAHWSSPARTIRVSYEPEIGHGPGDVRKLHPGRPWRPDVVVEIRWSDGTLDLHIFDAKYRNEAGGPPKEALRALWWAYGDGIGDAAGRPVVRSVWVVAPGDALWLVAPGMLNDGWPVERLRGGCVCIGPGSRSPLEGVLARLL